MLIDARPGLDCFAYRAHLNGRSVVYSGDTTMCDGLLRLIPGADVVVVECSCGSDPVHLSAEDVAQARRHAPDGASFIVTHLDGKEHPLNFEGLAVADDLKRFQLF